MSYKIKFARQLALMVGVLCIIANVAPRASYGFQETHDELIRKLQNESAKERMDAADQLGFLPELSTASVPALIGALEDSDAVVRWRSARALGNLGSIAKAAVPALRTKLGDPDSTVRIHAAKALGRMGDNSEETIRSLSRLIDESDQSVAYTCVHALQNLDDPSGAVVRSLGKALECNEHAVIIAAVESLVKRGVTSMPAIIDALQNEQTAMWGCIAVADIGEEAAEAVPHLAKLLSKETSAPTRMHAILALAAIGPDAQPATRDIISFARETNDLTERVSAAYALGAIGATDGTDFLIKSLESKDEFLRMIASWSLARINPGQWQDQAIQRLTEGLQSSKSEVRVAAAKGIQELDVPADAVASALMQTVSDPDPAVVENVINALVGLGPSAASYAGRSLTDQDKRNAALVVLARMGPDARDALPQMLAAVTGDDPAFAARVQLAIAEIGPPAESAVPKLVASLDSPNDRIRHSAMYALGRIGPAAGKARAALEVALEKSEGFDRLAASWALVRIFPNEQKFLEIAVQHLPKGLKSTDESVRMECCATLGEIGSKASSSIEHLMSCAHHDQSDLVREAAREAIEKIKNQK